MGRPRRPPAVLVEAIVKGNAKLAALPNDTARLGYFYVCLGDAKLQKPVPGQFASRSVFRETAGRFARFFNDYVKAGLLEVAPRLCARCLAKWGSMLTDGAVVVHDWNEHQYDPWHAERQAAYEARKALVSDAQSDAETDAQSDVVSDGNLTSNLTSISRAGPSGRGRGRVGPRAPNSELRTNERESRVPSAVPGRAGGATRKERNGGWTRVGEVDWSKALTAQQRDQWADFGPEWEAFREAWLGRGLKHPPSGGRDDSPDDANPSQRALLWSILDARPTDLPRWIREAPKSLSAAGVVAWAIERWHGARDEATERSASDDATWQARKEADRETAPQVVAEVAEVAEVFR